MDEFSDDGFDDLNDTILQELEDNAIQFTQAQKLAQSQVPVAARPPIQFDDDDLDDTVVLDQRSLPPQQRPGINKTLPTQQSRWNPQTHHPPPPQTRPTPVYPQRPQYPPPARPAAPIPSQRLAARPIPQPPQRPVPPPSQFARPPPRPSQFTRPPPPPVPRPFASHATQATQAAHGAGADKQAEVVAALQARLSALESELTAAKGEASIMRSKYEKAQVTHDAEITRIKKQHAEDAVKKERLLEAAQAAERTASTELHFMRQDLREELGRSKARKQDGTTTPKKKKSWGIVDGFDGLEMTGSPTKGQVQKKKDSVPTVVSFLERTPTKAKRKRPAVDSPTFALETHSEEDLMRNAPSPTISNLYRAGSEGLPFDFLKLVLDHSTFHGQPLTFDLLSRFALPSNPDQTFSSIIFQRLPQMGNTQEPVRLLVDFAQTIIDLWQQCLGERYHSPIYYLASLICYVLQLNTIAVAPYIISSLVPVCTTTCRLVVLPRFNSQDGDISRHPDNAVRQLDADGVVAQSFCLLILAALGCVTSPIAESGEFVPFGSCPQREFWRNVDVELVLVMLSPKHPEADWFGMLSLLWTSVLPESIGPIPDRVSLAAYEGNPQKERPSLERVATALIDRLSAFLIDVPAWATRGSVKELSVRLTILKTLILFAASPFGIVQIARSNVTVQRLVTVLCWAIDQLYNVDSLALYQAATRNPVPDESQTEEGDSLAPGAHGRNRGVDTMEVDGLGRQDSPASDPPGLTEGLIDDMDRHSSEMLCRIVAQAVLLLHTLVMDPRTTRIVNLAAQLATSSGCPQRYLQSLARLNFADEELVYEAGIDAATSELAHDLLEMAVTPDEGESMSRLFNP